MQVCREMKSNDFTHTSTVKVLIITGHFTVHENIHLLRSRFRPYADKDVELDENITLLLGMNDIDSLIRKEWTEQIAYAIDPNDSEEIDDALSAQPLPDGKFKVWIHIADPTSYVPYNSRIDREARNRGLTVYLPTCTSHMYPRQISMDRMSFRNGEMCRAVTVSVTLNKDGTYDSDGYSIDLQMVRVSMLTYGEADMFIKSDGSEINGSSLQCLLHAAKARFGWRMSQISDHVPRFDKHKSRDYRFMSMKVRSVKGEPVLDTSTDSIDNEHSPSHFIVDEMMLLAGNVFAEFGRTHGICLPYRGSNKYYYELEPRQDLGLKTGYVRCTSPLRRYIDCLVHYQLKSHLHNVPGLSYVELQDLVEGCGVLCEKQSKALLQKSKLYWVIHNFQNYHIKSAVISAELTDARRHGGYYGPYKYDASILIDCEGLFEYSTTVEDVPRFVYMYKPPRVNVIVKVADPHAGLLEFTILDE